MLKRNGVSASLGHFGFAKPKIAAVGRAFTQINGVVDPPDQPNLEGVCLVALA